MSRASSMEVKTPMEAPENLVEYRITRSKGVFGGVSYELRGSGRTPLLAATRAAMSQTFVISMQRRRLGAVDAVPRKAKLKTALVFNLEDKRRKDPVATLVRTQGAWAAHDRTALKLVVHSTPRVVLKSRDLDHFAFADVATDSVKNFELVDATSGECHARLLKTKPNVFKFVLKPSLDPYVAFAVALSQGFGPS